MLISEVERELAKLREIHGDIEVALPVNGFGQDYFTECAGVEFVPTMVYRCF